MGKNHRTGTPWNPGLQATWLRRHGAARDCRREGVTVGCEEPQGRHGLSADLGCIKSSRVTQIASGNLLH